MSSSIGFSSSFAWVLNLENLDQTWWATAGLYLPTKKPSGLHFPRLCSSSGINDWREVYVCMCMASQERKGSSQTLKVYTEKQFGLSTRVTTWQGERNQKIILTSSGELGWSKAIEEAFTALLGEVVLGSFIGPLTQSKSDSQELHQGPQDWLAGVRGCNCVIATPS